MKYRFTWAAALLVLMLGMALPVQGQESDADRAWQRKDWTAAERLYGAQLAADSGDTRAAYRLAMIKSWDGRYDQSVRLLDRLLASHPDYVDAAIDRARVIARWRSPAAGIAALDSVPAGTRNVAVLRARATLLSWVGDAAGEQATLEQLLRLAPDDLEAHLRHATLLARSDHRPEATTELRAVVAAHPDATAARLALADVLEQSGDFDAAEALYREVLTSEPGSGEALRRLAWLLDRQGRRGEAASTWREAVAANPSDVSGYVGYARNLRWQGRSEEALAVLGSAEALDPGNSAVAAERQWARRAYASAVSVRVTYGHDNEGNRITSTRFGTSFWPTWRVRLRADAYRHELGQVTVGRDRWSYGGGLGLDLRAGSRATLGVHAGASRLDSSADPTLGRWGASVALRPGKTLRMGLSYDHAPWDYTAQLVGNSVEVDEAQVSIGGFIPGAGTASTFDVGISFFHGLTENRRLGAEYRQVHTLGRGLRLGFDARGYGYSQQVFEGYFAPDFYGVLEAVTAWDGHTGPLFLDLEVTPGIRRKGWSGGDMGGTLGVDASTGFELGPGRTIGLTGGYTSSGDGLARDPNGYRYWSAGVVANWSF